MKWLCKESHKAGNSESAEQGDIAHRRTLVFEKDTHRAFKIHRQIAAQRMWLRQNTATPNQILMIQLMTR